jgi:hypothetical protein
MSNVTLAPSASDVKPAFSTAEILPWTLTSRTTRWSGGGVFWALAARNYNGASRACAAAIGGWRVSCNLPFFSEFWHFGWRGYSDLAEARHGAGQGA